MIKNKYYCWACDYSKETGEGQLARFFIEKKFSNNAVKIITPESINSKFKFLNIFLKYKYTSPLLGVIFNWFYFLKRKKTIYINYLPLWNFVIFLLLPPKTILGPITGGSLHSKNDIIRKNFFPLFYFISKIIIYLRFKKLYFSTDLLKKYFNNNFIRKNYFNFVVQKIARNKKINKKSIDFLIYYRKHNNKIHNFPYNLIKKIKSFGLHIHIIGDRLDIAGVTNHGFKKNFLVKKLLSKSKFSICSQENLYTLFTIECLNHDVKIIADKSFSNNAGKFKKKFIFIDFKKNNLSKNSLLFK